MNNQTKPGYRWGPWLGLAIIGMAALIVLSRSPKVARPRPVTFTFDTNGMAHWGRVPLLTTNIRDATFKALGSFGVKAGLAVPFALTNRAQESNLIETLNSMSRAGLLLTNQPPNPYE